MAACSVDGCEAPVRAVGMCVVHRMRLLRHGDVNTVRKAGRPAHEQRAAARDLFSDWSDRTFARWWTATRILQELVTEKGYETILKRCCRPNGSLNVAALEREARELWELVRPAFEDGPQDGR